MRSVNRLYSHDHKRVFSSIAAGNRYIIGVINQNIDLIVKREVGYQSERCLFSKYDRSMILLPTVENMSKWGNYFLMLKGDDDYSPFMNTILTTNVNERLQELNHNYTVLLEPKYKQRIEEIEGEIEQLHRYCSTSFFETITNLDYLKLYWNQTLEYMIDYIYQKVNIDNDDFKCRMALRMRGGSQTKPPDRRTAELKDTDKIWEKIQKQFQTAVENDEYDNIRDLWKIIRGNKEYIQTFNILHAQLIEKKNEPYC